jgi:hypothetical protein
MRTIKYITLLLSLVLSNVLYSQALEVHQEGRVRVRLDAGDDITITTLDSIPLIATVKNVDSLVWRTDGTGTITDSTAARTYYTPSFADEFRNSIVLTLVGYILSGQDTIYDTKVVTVNTSMPPLTKLLAYWRDDYGIEDDSTLVLLDSLGAPSDTIQLSLDPDADYIPMKSLLTMSMTSANTIDTSFWNHAIPPAIVFQNIDYDSTTYFKITAHQLNTDSTELYPRRITEIALYSSATDAMDYFDVPNPIGLFVAPYPEGNDTTGNGTYAAPYHSYAKAATIGNTRINVRSGAYNMAGTYMTITDTLYNVGLCRYSNSGTSYAFLVNQANTMVKGVHYIGASGYYFFVNGANGFTVRDGYFSGAKTRFVYNSTSGANALNVVNNVVKDINYGSYVTMSVGHLTVNVTDNLFSNCTNSSLLTLINTTGANVTLSNNSIDITGGNGIVSAQHLGTVKILSNYLSGDINSVFFYQSALNGIVKAVGNTGFANGFVQCLTGTGDVYVAKNQLTNASDQNMVMTTNRDLYAHDNNFLATGTGAHIVVNASTSARRYVEIKRNVLRSTSAGGASSVSETAGDDSIYCTISDNYLDFTGSTATHGIQVYDEKHTTMVRNKSLNCLLPFIFKGDGHDFTGAVMAYNIARNGRLVIKGVDSAYIYNNTVSIDDTTNTNKWCIDLINNGTGKHCNGNVLKNNVFSNTFNSTKMYTIYQATDEVTFVSDYNLLYCPYNKIAKLESTEYTFTTWKAAGYDAHGYNSNPSFSSETLLLPSLTSDANGKGVNLGTDYDDAILPASTWPSAVTTETQDSAWDIGAFKIE